MLAFAFPAFAQVSVVESKSLAQQQAELQQIQKTQREDNAANASAQLFHQLQILQDEVMRLRGELEEQSHQMRVLKQQRLDDYVNLDKRIADLSNATNARAMAAQNASTASADNDSGDKEAYKEAYALLLEKKNPQAKQAFEEFLLAFEGSIYRPNAYYWLGKLYVMDSQYAKAVTVFGEIIKQYADNRRVPEAMFEQARAKFQLGQREPAKAQFDDLVLRYQQSSPKIAQQAREFIQKNYP